MSRILLVDDNSALLAAAGRALREAGHVVTSTNNGADTLYLLKAKPPPELIVLDIHMPGVDGFSVLRELGPASPPVVVITGHITEDTLHKPPVVRVLKKPFTYEQLIEAVDYALGQKPGGAQ